MPTRRPPLVAAGVVVLAATAAHTLDHVRQGTGDLATEVIGGGAVLSAGVVITLVLILRGSPTAPLAAVLVGFATAFGVAASHLAPHWSAFSDPYPGQGLDVLSWAAMLFELGAGLVLGLAGLRELRRGRRADAGAPVASAGRA